MNRLVAIVACLLFLSAGNINLHAVPVQITGNNVNLRASTNDRSEVVTQVSAGQILEATRTGEEWIQVIPPQQTAVWIHGGLVRDSVVSSAKARVRAGPGINFTTLFTASQGAKVEILGQFNDWLKISAPPGCYLYVNNRFIKEIPPTKQSEVPATQSASTPPEVRTSDSSQNRTSSEFSGLPQPVPANQNILDTDPDRSTPSTNTAIRLPSGVSTEDLIAGVEQGRRVQVRGTLRTSGFLFRRRPDFRLVQEDEKQALQTVCYVQGDSKQLETLTSRSMTIWGREYWIQGLRHSLVIPERIILPKQ